MRTKIFIYIITIIGMNAIAEQEIKIVPFGRSVVFCESSLTQLNLDLLKEKILVTDTKIGMDDDRFKIVFEVNFPFEVSAPMVSSDQKNQKYCVTVTKL